jgi:PAS domain S-box-containing protein
MDFKQTSELRVRSESIPRWIGAYAEKVINARARPTRLKRVFDRSSVPMTMVDDERRYIEVNTPARLISRLSLAELRQLRIDDLTPRHQWSALEAAWQRLLETECVAGPHQVLSLDGCHLEVTYYALANALPGLHLIAFAPADWPDGELIGDLDEFGDGPAPVLTPRELEVLELAAEGRNGPMIAEELVVSASTVRTHFEHIYEKLDVRDRAAAVAKAMRLGVIV